MSIPLRVLIVEDSEDDALLTLRELRRAGYDLISERVDTIETMKSALNRHTWDIVLSDYAMPSLSMLTALAMAQEKACDVPFVIVSGAIGEEAAVAAMRAGARDYVMKSNLARLVPVVEREVLEAEMRLQRNRMEQALRELWEEIWRQWRQMLSIFDGHSEMLYVADPETYEILFVNTAMKNAFSKELVGGKCYEEFQHLDAPCDFCTNGIILKERKPYTWEHHNPILDRDLLITDQIIRWPDGRAVRFEIALDVTERKIAGQEVAVPQGRMVQFERAKASGEIAAGVAHDVNNLLSIILSRAEMALKDVRDTNLKKSIKVIEQAAIDSSKTVSRLRVLTGTQRGDALEMVGLNQLVDEALQMVETRRVELEKTGSIAIAIGAELGEVAPVLGDAAQLREVLVNLIFNAMNAMPEGGEIEVKTWQEDSQVILAISDTGMGIPEEIRGKIFDPFFTTRGSKGAGLGLSVTRGIVTKHGGRIDVESTEGQGSTFYVSLPAANGHEEG